MIDRAELLNKSISNLELKINPEYAKLVPPLTDQEYSSLKEDIKKNGQLVPITINQDGFILDGHHRFRVCQELGIEPQTEIIDTRETEEDEIVIKTNLLRRQLNDFQKAELGFKLEQIYSEPARQRQLSVLKQDDRVPALSFDNIGGKGRTGDLISLKIGMKPASYNRAKKIILEGCESRKERLRSGKSSIFKEYKRIQIEQKKKQLTQEKPIINIPDGCQLYPGDFMEVGKQIPDNSIDLILTDPPYAQEYLPLYEKLGVFANRVLKVGGSLVTFVGQTNLVKQANLIEESGLKYRWPLYVHHNGHHALQRGFGTQIEVCGKEMLLFVKGNNGRTRNEGFIADFIESIPPKKEMHEWEQSTVEAEQVIKGFTVENQIVLDPFMGYATNGVTALKLNRKFIGIEIDPIHYSNAQRRLSMLELEVYQK
jgi:DNA methylase/ParB-like nuclease domain